MSFHLRAFGCMVAGKRSAPAQSLRTTRGVSGLIHLDGGDAGVEHLTTSPPASFPCCSIRLSGGHVALVDAVDFEMLSHWKWYAKARHGLVYAVTKQQSNGVRRQLYMHRVLCLPDPCDQVDHINGDGLDNRRSNLRAASACDNAHNRRPPRGNESPIPRGVSWHPRAGRWMARIKCSGVSHYLGLFDTAAQAGLAYQDAASRLHGDFVPVPCSQLGLGRGDAT